MPATTLTSLPDEVIQSILVYLPPTSTVSVQLTCRRLQNVASEPLIWKDYCRRTFRWWDRRHSLASKLADPSFTAWKQLFATRADSSWHTRTALDSIINDQVGRLDSIQLILKAGYDAKDDLFSLFWNAAVSRNHLAQRYVEHTNLVIKHICYLLAPDAVTCASILTLFLFQVLVSCRPRLSPSADGRRRMVGPESPIRRSFVFTFLVLV